MAREPQHPLKQQEIVESSQEKNSAIPRYKHFQRIGIAIQDSPLPFRIAVEARDKNQMQKPYPESSTYLKS